jgi:hypothetical protein
VSLIAVIFFALYFHKRLEERHLGKLALAGMLKHSSEAVPSASAQEPRFRISPTAILSYTATSFTAIAGMIPRVSFHRRGANDSTPAAANTDASHVPASVETKRPQRSLRDAFEQDTGDFRANAPVRSAPAHDPLFVDRQFGTIDLKKMQKLRKEGSPSEGNVINLKRR